MCQKRVGPTATHQVHNVDGWVFVQVFSKLAEHMYMLAPFLRQHALVTEEVFCVNFRVQVLQGTGLNMANDQRNFKARLV